MAKFRNAEATPLWVPEYNTNVDPGGVIEVPDSEVDSFLGAQWSPVGATKATAKHAAEETKQENNAGTAPAAGLDTGKDGV